MRKILMIAIVAAFLMTVPVSRAEDPPASPQVNASQDADAALAEFEAIRPPQFDRTRQGDPAYRQEYQAQMKAAMENKVERARAFYDRFPDHPKAGKVMSERWQILPMLGQRDVVEREVEEALAKGDDSPIASAARFVKAQIALRPGNDFEQQVKAVDEFIEADPEDPRGADLLVQLASWGTDDAGKQRQLLERVRKDYPDTRAAEAAEGKLRQVEGVGQPFELTFTDAVSGKEIDVQKDLKGKVIVVDFWATWCGPCVAEMPKMKSLYEQYKDKGVEFIGVSLDQPEEQGGLEALKKFVDENDIPWPQYYQGKGWQSEFSSNWGINSIPALFVVDAQGKLHSTSARGKLEQMIPELLAKRDNKAATAR